MLFKILFQQILIHKTEYRYVKIHHDFLVSPSFWLNKLQKKDMDNEKNEYDYKLIDALDMSISEFLRVKGSILVTNYEILIEKINSVFSNPNTQDIKLPKIFSGEVLEVNVRDEIKLMEKTDDGGAMSRQVSFLIWPAKISFNHEKDNFDIIDINGIRIIGITR